MLASPSRIETMISSPIAPPRLNKRKRPVSVSELKCKECGYSGCQDLTRDFFTLCCRCANIASAANLPLCTACSPIIMATCCSASKDCLTRRLHATLPCCLCRSPYLIEDWCLSCRYERYIRLPFAPTGRRIWWATICEMRAVFTPPLALRVQSSKYCRVCAQVKESCKRMFGGICCGCLEIFPCRPPASSQFTPWQCCMIETTRLGL